MLSAASAPVVALILGGTAGLPLVAFGVAMAALIVFTHRSNILRMRRGEENRFSRSWLARR